MKEVNRLDSMKPWDKELPIILERQVRSVFMKKLFQIKQLAVKNLRTAP
jgi:hypothetical protein